MDDKSTEIEKILTEYSKADISIAPTPLHKLKRLSSILGHNIYIKREDLTGFNIGGNKNRKLDYLIGDALSRNADTLITTAASSFSRNTAAAGKVYGLDVHVIVAGGENDQNRASQALFKQLDANLYYTSKSKVDAVSTEYNRVLKDLKSQGRHIYELHPGGSDNIGSLGYLDAFNEIVEFTKTTNIRFNKIFHPCGSTATQAGLVLGNIISEYESEIIGIAVSQKSNIQIERVHKLTQSTADMLNITYDKSNIIVDDRFLGPGYSISSQEGIDAAKLFATTEGILLDDVYTAKAAAGLIYYAKNRLFNKNDNILFIHTGGNSGLFY
ncbi:MAG TPA: pyridoxal-phosphate dependent enzyme [Victivallales bacterium]|nr:pyridoxal-phosphate dependent enzyme [Victivallales bacterium]